MLLLLFQYRVSIKGLYLTNYNSSNFDINIIAIPHMFAPFSPLLLVKPVLCQNYAILQIILLQMNEQQEKQCEYIDEYRVIKQLGSGYQAIVYLCVDNEGGHVAVKKFKRAPSVNNNIEEEIQAMEALHHENLIKLISVRQNAVYRSKEGYSTSCFAFVLEFAAGGELFDFVADTGKFSQKVTRTYFHQMMNGIHYMHERGYAHRDIKPQNLLLSDTFVLKIADFGFSCLLKGRDGKGVLKTKLGTEGYMAPEIFCKEYEGRKTDIFAAGVILFIMYTGSPPFEKASINDPYYKLIRQKKILSFWQSHAKKRPFGFFSDSFKDLFERMVAFEPHQRPTIYEIAKHPWVKIGICTHSEILKEFIERKQRLLRILQERKRQREEEENNLAESIVDESSNSFRGGKENKQFTEDYIQERLKKREWPLMEEETKYDIMVNNNDTEFVLCRLRDLLSKISIDLQLKNAQEEDLIQAQCQVSAMTVDSTALVNDSLQSVFMYRTPIKDMVMLHRLPVQFHLGKSSQGHTLIRIITPQDHFYYNLIRKTIQLCFA